MSVKLNVILLVHRYLSSQELCTAGNGTNGQSIYELKFTNEIFFVLFFLLEHLDVLFGYC